VFGLLSTGPLYGQAWERVSNEDGVVVETREVPGQALPTFRGTATVAAPLLEVAAVIDDVDRACQWTKRCVGSRRLQRITDTDLLFYSRTSAPWPVQDRDAVMLGKVTGLAEARDVMIAFHTVRSPLQPEVNGVVRMPRVRGHYRLTRLSDTATRVEFQVQADIGGWVPDSLAAMTSKTIPRDTLKGLRRQVSKMRGHYTDFLKKYQAPGAPATPSAPATPGAAPAPVAPAAP